MEATSEGGWSTERLVEAGGRTALAGTVGLSGLAMYVLWYLVLGSIASLGGKPSPAVTTVLNTIALALGMGTAAGFYLRTSGRGIDFLDLSVPTRRDGAWALVGVVGLFVMLYTVGAITAALGVEQATHGTVAAAKEDPIVALVSVPVSWLLVGPSEELMFRNVVQKSLYDVFSRRGAILVGTVIFAMAHFSAYLTGGATRGQILASLAVTFLLALILGIVYERTDNLLVSAFVHGTFNGVQFLDLYCELTKCGVPILPGS